MQILEGHSTASSPSGRRPLTNDFFVNLLDMSTTLEVLRSVFEGRSRDRRAQWTAPAWISSSAGSQLRALGGSLRMRGRQGAVVHDFVAAWSKVMNLDRFDSA